MNEKKLLRPSVKINYISSVFGAPAYVIESGNEKVAFGSIEDLLVRLVKHFEPDKIGEQMEAPPRQKRGPHKDLPPHRRRYEIPIKDHVIANMKNMKVPVKTAQMYDILKKFYPNTTKGSIYSAFYQLRKGGLIRATGNGWEIIERKAA